MSLSFSLPDSVHQVFHLNTLNHLRRNTMISDLWQPLNPSTISIEMFRFNFACVSYHFCRKRNGNNERKRAREYISVCVSFCLHCTNVAYFNSMSHSLSDARQVVVYFCFNCRYVEMVLRFTSFWFTTPFMCIKHWHSMCIVNACSIKMNDEIHRRQWLVIELKRESFGRLWWWWRQCHGMQWHANITNMCKCTSISKQL